MSNENRRGKGGWRRENGEGRTAKDGRRREDGEGRTAKAGKKGRNDRCGRIELVVALSLGKISDLSQVI